MNHLKILHEFLHENRSPADLPVSDYPFVTISREAGAGGHLLSYVLITEFLKLHNEVFRGWHVFDRELCRVVAEDPCLHGSMDSLIREEHRSEFGGFMDGLFTGRASSYLLDKKTFAIVRMLATIGKVIIVGRCASC